MTSKMTDYRNAMAVLLLQVVQFTGKVEQRLEVNEDEGLTHAAVEENPYVVFRQPCMLLLRKARIHAFAALRANESDNVHSLAVQMRPVLECAGQTVFLFRSTLIEPEHSEMDVSNYLDADYYQTFIKLIEGDNLERQTFLHSTIQSAHDKLKEMYGADIERGNYTNLLRQDFKVSSLVEGKNWYSHLSEYFCHGKADWKGLSYQGGVSSTGAALDDLAFATLMDYLVHQVAIMNAYASLYLISWKRRTEFFDSIIAQLDEVQTAVKKYREGAVLEDVNMDEWRLERLLSIGESRQQTEDEPRQEMRVLCEGYLDSLRELVGIHLEIDAPTRMMQSNEPDWIGRLRKMFFHAKAIDGWEIGTDVVHVMATELRPAFVQMGEVWKQLPDTIRIDEISGSFWADEARSGVLATYDHPTPQTLMLSIGRGGFGNGEGELVYAQLCLWLSQLELGYGLALVHLSEVLGSGENVESRVTELLAKLGGEGRQGWSLQGS